jgi:hypothetical protein
LYRTAYYHLGSFLYDIFSFLPLRIFPVIGTIKNAIVQNRTSTGKKDDEDSGYLFLQCTGKKVLGVHQNHGQENAEGHRTRSRRISDLKSHERGEDLKSLRKPSGFQPNSLEFFDAGLINRRS